MRFKTRELFCIVYFAKHLFQPVIVEGNLGGNTAMRRMKALKRAGAVTGEYLMMNYEAALERYGWKTAVASGYCTRFAA